MITLIVPTRNRAHTLRRVASSYFAQDGVNELIFVSDAGEDESEAIIREVAQVHPDKTVRFLRNQTRLGASQSRNLGVAASSNEFILFCDDDEYLEQGYARIALDKLQRYGAGAVSGRRIYLRPGESITESLRRFGNGLRRVSPFNRLLCEYVNGAKFSDDIRMPFTNAIILTRKNLLQKFPYDGYYARGNGYREETDFQMNLFVHGYSIYVTNDCHSFHLPLSEVRRGGQRTDRFRRIYWSIFYTRYFFAKYYGRYARLVNLNIPAWAALCSFSVFSVYRETLRPGLYAVAIRLVGSR